MTFSANSYIIFVIVGIVIAAVLGQSIFFLVKALKRAKQLGIAGSTVKKTVSSSAIFTIAPAVAVLLGVVVLSKTLGVPLPWLRLSVVGSLSYELVAAENTARPLGLGSELVDDPSAYITILFVMTISIALSLVLAPIMTKKVQSGVSKIGMKDKKWGEIFSNAMFLGMISAFLGYVFCDVTYLADGFAQGFTPVCVMLVSAVVMAVLGILATKFKVTWLTDYALPISLICGMASAILFSDLFDGYEITKEMLEGARA